MKEGHINSIEEIMQNNYRIREPEIVDALFPELRQEVVDVSLVQRQMLAQIRKKSNIWNSKGSSLI